MVEDHPGKEPAFEMKASSFQLKPVERQAEEAAKVEDFDGHQYLNRCGK